MESEVPKTYLIIQDGRYWKSVDAWTEPSAAIRASVMLHNAGLTPNFTLIEDDRHGEEKLSR